MLNIYLLELELVFQKDWRPGRVFAHFLYQFDLSKSKNNSEMEFFQGEILKESAMKNAHLLNNRGPLQCSFSNMKIMSEVRKDLSSGIKMKCEMCHFQETVWTEDPECKKMPVNTAAVSGIMKIGGFFANLEEFLSTLDIPPLISNTYQKEHDNIASAREKVAENEMYCAAMEEKHLVVQAGEVGGDGIPLLTVVVDGCWAKRSYKTNYSSLSGAAAIVGFRTKKVLYMAERNRYCMQL
ncbi:uncharacterized protein NPIL_637651 [Nephila pilipes]|uniref:Mutator-like transposase domain-containing protein n=1 Tax=Nephila pilipes TaxID=299642 RepID=A0A8X6PWT9_NEPPI|nr:uncharacterized protein NPIL_637651 [Nephila pilipes]